MSKVCIVNQFFELGDIMFIEPIYRHYHEQGYEVIAPVNSEYLWIQDYIPYVKFVDKARFPYNYESPVQPEDGRLHLPLRFAHPLYRGYDLHYGDDRTNWMCDKYLYLGLDKDMWRTMRFDRKHDKEMDLFEKLNTSGPYNLVNEHFGGSFEKVPITITNDLPCVYMERIPGYTLLDWMKVIQGAENIYTPETSLIYLIESFEVKAKELHLYPRYPFLENVDYIKQYLTKNWICHDATNL